MSLRVIGAGVGRTGTTSLKAALEVLLGEPCYHMHEVLIRPKRHVPLWQAALDGELSDWDEIFGPYAATVDWPGAAFWPELAGAYPDALVLLSVRDSADDWFGSASRTINELMAQPPTADTAAWHAMNVALLARRFAPVPFEPGVARAAYERHNAEVRATVPPDRLLEWRPGDGWAPICERLGLPVPDQPFPHLNTGDEFAAMLADTAAPGAPRRRSVVRRAIGRLRATGS